MVLGMLAMYITWANWHGLIGQAKSLWQWQTLVVAWTTIIAVTVAHEYGHGLACKKYGGEVREMGVLWIFFTPCFFCNVSDAWLLPSRSKRLIVSMAGTYIDFLIWIVAVFVCAIAVPNTWISVATWLIVTSCGLRVAFNLNPLMRLDGYYALSDALGVHNLKRRGRARIMDFSRWILWGAERPHRIPDGKVLLTYGMVQWTFVIGVMTLLTFNLSSSLQPLMGVGGVMAAGSFFVLIAKRYFKGSLGEDFKTMFKSRKLRVLLWAAIIGGVGMIPITDCAGGEFFVRPIVHAEVRRRSRDLCERYPPRRASPCVRGACWQCLKSRSYRAR